MGNILESILENSHKRCKTCEKDFYVPNSEDWVYRRGSFWFCSWSCLRKYEKAHEKPKKEKPVREYEKYHTCFECRFYHDGQRKCDRGITLYPYPHRDACSQFREIKDDSSVTVWKRGQAKFTEEDIQEIKRLYKEEYVTQQAIADRYGVSRSYIVSILER